MPEIPADWYINRTVSLSAELAEAHKGMATMAAALNRAQADLAQVRAELHNATAQPAPEDATTEQP